MPVLGTLGAATAKGVGFTAVPAELPGTPTISTATVTGGVSVSVAYTAPAFDGNTSILSYTGIAFNYPSGTAVGITGIAFGPNSGSVTVSGLTPGAAYTFKVYATNGIGDSGLSSASNNVTTWVVPTAPTIGTVTYTAGNSFASVAYTQSSSNGGTPIISYTAVAYVSGVASGQTGTLLQATSGSIQVNGLIAGQSYTFRVFATNLVGDSPNSNASSPATSVFTKPNAPTIGTATFTAGTSATVGFTAPANNGGAAISSYSVRAYIAGVSTSVTGSGVSSPLSITGLTKGTTYTFRVTATNTYGTSDPSADSNSITPLTVAAAPTIGTPVATSGTSVNVNFTAPIDTGGISTYITSYTATSTPGNISVTRTTGLPTPGTTSVINIPGLTKGQPYTFTVYATNPVGNSANSSASISITPADVPNAPTINLVTTSTANTGIGTVIVNYSAPADNGGAVITSYTAVSTPSSVTASVSTAASGTITVTGLTKGTAYTFVVFATNRVGNSVNSNTSSPAITPLTVPAAPTINTATAIGSTTATVSYLAPTDTGGSGITNFIATSTPAVTLGQAVTSPGLITMSGLTKGQSYTFTVAAVNAQGAGASSASSNSITTWIEPGAPTIGTATEVNATTATIAFTAGTTGGTPIVDFTATAYISGVATAITATGISSPITVTGLTQGTTYTLRVTARNFVGTGAASGASNTVQPADRPSKPTAPTVTTSTTYTSDGRVTVTFTAPYDGGTTILDYSLVSNPATTTSTVTQAAGGTYVFTGLTKGTTYTFAYAARNRIGTSTYSDASSSITPLTVPNVPVIGSATRFDATSVNVAYNNSTDTGGTAITSYTATSTPSSITGSGSNSPITVTGLTKGTPYTFTVRANNSRGSSGESISSNSATPATIPNAPTIGTATTISKNSVSVSFTAPADDGGNAIFSYTAVATPGRSAVTINQAGSGTITVTGLLAATTYTFTVWATNTYGISADSQSSNSATTLNSYAVSASPTTINETSSRTVTFTITTIGVANGSTMYWTNTGTTSAADFDDNVNSGSFTISASGSPPVGSGSVSRTTVTDLFTEGTETIVFNLQLTPGTTEATATVNISDTSLTPVPTYSITADQTSINETTNRIVTFSISTTYVPNGTTLYWQVSTVGGVSAADFTSSITGSVTMSGATGTPPTGATASFSLATTTDQLTDSGETFWVWLGTNTPAALYSVTNSSTITIQDTSLTPGVVTISPTTAGRNIVYSGVAQTITGTYVTTMSSGAVGTITNQPSAYNAVFSAFSVSPTTRTFTALGQTQTASWSMTTNANEYSTPSFFFSWASLLDTRDLVIPNNYPTHTITLTRIAYTENITVSPASGTTNTTFTYTITGAPGTTAIYQNSVDGTATGQTPVALSGSAGDAGAGTFTQSGAYWSTPGTYTVYVRWLATDHGDSFFNPYVVGTGYATNTRVSVTVTYPALTITAGFALGTFWQIGQSGVWGASQTTFTASGGSGSGYSFATPGLPGGLTQSSATGTVSGTPTVTGNYPVTTTVTDSASNTANTTYTLHISNYPVVTSYSLTGSRTAFTVGESIVFSWDSANTSAVWHLISPPTTTVIQRGSSGSASVTNSPAGSYTVYIYPLFFNSQVYYTGSVTLSYTVYDAPTASWTVTPAGIWADGASYFSTSWSSTGGTTFTLVINGSIEAFTASGTSSPGPYTNTSDVTYSTYTTATNAAGTSVNSATSTNIVYAMPGLTASWTASTSQIVVSWSTTNTTSTTANAYITQPMANSGSQTFTGPFTAGSTFSLSITATRSLGIGSRAVTKSATVSVPGSGSFS